MKGRTIEGVGLRPIFDQKGPNRPECSDEPVEILELAEGFCDSLPVGGINLARQCFAELLPPVRWQLEVRPCPPPAAADCDAEHGPTAPQVVPQQPFRGAGSTTL